MFSKDSEHLCLLHESTNNIRDSGILPIATSYTNDQTQLSKYRGDKLY